MKKELSVKLSEIARMVVENRSYRDTEDGIRISSSPFLNKLMEKLIPFMVHRISPKVKKYFYAEESCTGCGICASLCPSGKIEIVEKRPTWNRKMDRYMCYCCLNACPEGAVQIYSKIWMKSYTAVKGRYPHPLVTIKELKDQIK